MNHPIVNALTIDLEDYYMVSAFESVVKREDWHRYESRIERNTYRVLEILDETKPPSPDRQDGPDRTHGPAQFTSPTSLMPGGVKATFFCLGWVGERYGHLIREIVSRGHEIACHGYDHQLVYRMTPEQFREDVLISKRILEDASGTKVIGYRAPSYSITQESLWALDILGEEGYRYDSSIFPIHHDRYGIPTAPRFPFLVKLNGNGGDGTGLSADFEQLRPRDPGRGDSHDGCIVEVPISTVRLMGFNIPISGGGYMRLFPYGVIRQGLSKINNVENQPFVFYLHPWEFDPEQPRMNHLSPLSRFRHYINLDGTADKLKNLLRDFSFSTMETVIGLR
ncbi:MAG: Peptidoglycan deacetylase [Syntrophus sp. PtaU1.Bin208]|nr:MAG: Peptidoglycan deacetylase [Syntrophus sp. PtaU1.Bin208]